MLLEVTPDGLINMHVSSHPFMTQFVTSIESDGQSNGTLTVAFKSPGSKDEPKTLRVPLMPDTEKMEPMAVNMHSSPTDSFKMRDEHSKWFSECFGYEVLFVYLGDNRRKVLFADMPSASWVPTIAKSIPFLSSVSSADHRIGFADCAPYLITSTTSLANVSDRLPEDQSMDMTKFRPNIVIEGADEAWEEDYWRRIRVGNADILLLHNCVRCTSINIDYATGKPGTNESGEVLKRLQKDRRIDTGSKYSPVFGRYGFWGNGNLGRVLKVGDEVTVTEVNKERTVIGMLSSLFTFNLLQSADFPRLAWSIRKIS
jgi:uncharacterized protein YcbX